MEDGRSQGGMQSLRDDFRSTNITQHSPDVEDELIRQLEKRSKIKDHHYRNLTWNTANSLFFTLSPNSVNDWEAIAISATRRAN